MVNRCETYFVAYNVYFTAELHQWQFENLVIVIMSTRENKRLIARSSLELVNFEEKISRRQANIQHYPASERLKSFQ